MIFARYDHKSIYKDIQKVKLGEMVKLKKYYENSELLCFFQKNHFLTLFYNFCGTNVKQTYC